MSLQQQIDSLMCDAQSLFSSLGKPGFMYADELSEANRRIHLRLTKLYPCHGATPEQEASLCLAMLMGYSVSMYANPEDERKKREVLDRSRQLLESLSPSLLKEQLGVAYSRLNGTL